MLKVTVSSLLSHKLRLVLTTIAILIGVASVSGTLIFIDTINSTFNSIFQAANSGVAVTVRGHELRGSGNSIGGAGRNPIPTSLLAPVRSVAGVQNAVGVIFRDGATLIGPDGKPVGGNGPPTFGANWVTDSQISPYHLRSGAAPTRAGDVVIDAGTASSNNLHLGQTVSIAFIAAPVQTFTITGIAGFGNSNSLAGATISLFTEATAERVLDGQNKYDEIDVSARSGVSDTALRDRIASQLPSYAEAQTGQQAAQQSTEATISTFIGTPLLVFAGIFLFVGSFLIVNTFNILVAQRTRELALLRALGATRRQVLTSVLVEATLTGLVASAIGVLVGLGIASALEALINAPPGTKLSLQPRSFIVGIAVGVVVTVLAATFPARRATRVPPVAALREALPDTQSVPRRRIVSGAVVLALGCVLFGIGVSGATSASLELLGAGVLAIFIGVAMLAPLVVGPIAEVLGWPVQRLRGVAGLLARENARRNPRRTALTAAALMIGLALVTSVAVLTDSFRASSDAAIEGALKGDFIVFDKNGGDFSPAVATALKSNAKVRDVTELRSSTILIGSASQQITAADPVAAQATLSLEMSSGDQNSIATTNTAVVDSAEATSRNLHVGSQVTVGFPEGADVTLRVGGVYEQNAIAQGYLVSLATLQPFVSSATDAALLVNAAPGTSLQDAESSLQSQLKQFPLVDAMSRSEYRDFVGKQIDSFLNLITGLLFLALVIAALGIVNTLALSVLERTREIGLIRALGMTRGQTRSMVRWESVLISLIGAVLGLVVGVAIGVALASALHNLGIDHVAVPGGNLLYYAIVAGIFGVLAAIFPALRASRLDVLQAIYAE